MNRDALVELLLQLADDDLVIGHRHSEWLGLAPHFEEDIAFASIAQDEVGHATAFYRLLEEFGVGKADDLAFVRPGAERRNAVLVERVNGSGTYLENPAFDWGYAVARSLAYDLFDAVRLEALTRSAYEPLALLAGKIRREERYHLLHHATWFKRLAQGTAESRRRLEAGIARTWADVDGLFAPGSVADPDLLPVSPVQLVERWESELQPQFAAVGLAWPGTPVALAVPAAPTAALPDGRRGQHTTALTDLLATMCEVYRTAPEAVW